MAISVYTSLLVKDYKRKAGEIKALRKELREAAKVVLKKERELAALRTIINAREPDLDLESVKPVATYPKALNLKWNRLTVLILSCLREAKGVPVGNVFIADYVIEKGNLAVNDRTALMAIRLSVRKRINNLAADGKVIGHHDKKTNTGARWTLPGSGK